MRHQFDPITRLAIRMDYWLNRMWKYKGRCSWLGLWRSAGEFSRDVYWEDNMNDHSIAACRASADRVLAYVRRREWLCKSHPVCPQCGEKRQLQLTDHLWADKAQWRCRMCRHRFEYEPEQ